MNTIKNYDNFFLPADKLDTAKDFYKNTLGLDIKFDFSERGMVAFKVGDNEPAIILRKADNVKPAILFTVDKANNQIRVKRSFNAPLDLVWAAWTNPEILEQWVAPKPWWAETKTKDFREGGFWHYAMIKEKHWSRYDYQKIKSPFDDL